MRTPIIANEGMVLTNDEIYGKVIYLAEGVSPDAFYEITDAEYAEILAKQQAEMEAELGMPPGYVEPTDPDAATEEDYQSALGEFGVQL